MKTTEKNYSSIGWAAWVDTMPGPGPTAKTLHVIGSVNAPTPCHEPELVPDPDVVSVPEVLPLKLEFEVSGGVCLQVITVKAVQYVDPDFAGGRDSVLVALPDGVSIWIPIEEIC